MNPTNCNLFFIEHSEAFCHRLAPGGSLDEIIRWLNQHRPNIESLDMWRTGHFSQSGMEMLVGLTRLRGLDLGWWYV